MHMLDSGSWKIGQIPQNSVVSVAVNDNVFDGHIWRPMVDSPLNHGLCENTDVRDARVCRDFPTHHCTRYRPGRR